MGLREMVGRVRDTIAMGPTLLHVYRAQRRLAPAGPGGETPFDGFAMVRGIRTASAVESHPDWVWPYWIERQFDPACESFVPRSHYHCAINVTHRNWSVVGAPGSPHLGRVDPRGLATPWPQGWSLDTWVSVGEETLVPAQLSDVTQRLGSSVPGVVITEWSAHGVNVSLETVGVELEGFPWLVVRAMVQSDEATEGWVHFSIRPYNAEGIAPISSLRFKGYAFSMDDLLGPVFPDVPDRVDCSNEERGDVFLRLDGPESHHAICHAGLATGVAGFRFAIDHGSPRAFRVFLPLEAIPAGSRLPAILSEELCAAETVRAWNKCLDGAARVSLPDERLSAALGANLEYLNLFSREEDPATASSADAPHDEAAFVIAALDAWGFHEQALAVLEALLPLGPRPRGVSGGRSKAEDPRLVWAALNHYAMTGRRDFLERFFSQLSAGVGQLQHSMRGAERIWAAAALHELSAAARVMNRAEEAARWDQAARTLTADMERSGRGGGGNEAGYAWSFPFPEAPFPYSLSHVEKAGGELAGGAYYDMARSGYDLVRSFKTAEFLMGSGDDRARKTLRWALDHATPTFTWPRAIHPRTRGGSMGEGHSRMVAAAFVLFVRNLLLREEGDTLSIGGLMPAEWFRGGQVTSVERAATRFGTVSFTITSRKEEVDLDLHPRYWKMPQKLQWIVPFDIVDAEADGMPACHRSRSIFLLPQTRRATLKRRVNGRESRSHPAPDLTHTSVDRIID